MTTEKKVSITVLLPGGRLPLDLMSAVHKIADDHGLGIYLSTLQNLRLIDVPESLAGEIKEQLTKLGVELKAPGKFPVPRVCVGQDHCNLGLIDTHAFSRKILDNFSDRKITKAKLKIAVAACAASCSNPKNSDIGVVRTNKGYEVYAGGKGGISPKVGLRIAKNIDEDNVLEIIETLIEFHDKKTEKKKRMFKLLDDPGFPYSKI